MSYDQLLQGHGQDQDNTGDSSVLDDMVCMLSTPLSLTLQLKNKLNNAGSFRDG